MPRFRSLLVAALIAASAALPADAAVAADDPATTSNAPARWELVWNVSMAELGEVLRTRNMRIVDLEVAPNGNDNLSAVLIENTGPYRRSPWWWYVNLRPDELKAKVAEHQARIVDLEGIVVGGKQYFSAVLVDNTGPNAKSWWWYVNVEPSQIDAAVKANNARIIDLDSYGSDHRRRTVVMVANTGVDARAWWYLYNVDRAYFKKFVEDNEARITNLVKRGPDRYDLVLVRSEGQSWWWFTGKTPQELAQLAHQKKARLFQSNGWGTGLMLGGYLPEVDCGSADGACCPGSYCLGSSLYCRYPGNPVKSNVCKKKPSGGSSDEDSNGGPPGDGAATREKICGIGGCSSGYHPVSYQWTLQCPGNRNEPDKPNQTTCEADAGLEFSMCGLGPCPSGYEKISTSFWASCNAFGGTSNEHNRTRCRKK